MVTSELLVDEVGAKLLVAHSWWYRVTKTRTGKVYRYVETKIKGRKVLFHRLLTGAKPGECVDHINGNTLDNRLANLRVCSHTENMRNRAINANHPVGFKGVQRRPCGTYTAEIKAGGIRRRRSGFKSAEEAAAAYAEMAAELHGDFARVR